MDVRQQFPALDRQIYGKPLIYFDNAATAQRPRSVLDLQERLALESNGNIHRAIHTLSAEATDRYEAGREAVRRYLVSQGVHRQRIRVSAYGNATESSHITLSARVIEK